MGTASTQQKKAGESVRIQILGNEHASSDRTTPRGGVQVIEVKNGEPVRIQILGNERTSSDRTTRSGGLQVIEVKNGERVTWENAQDEVCTITFTKGGCAFGHNHDTCNFSIEPKRTRSEDIVNATVGREFEFSASSASPQGHGLRGTPKIIVTG